MSEPTAGKRFEEFVDLIARLRAPGGCPWDREQTHESLKPMTIEEAYEVLEAIDGRNDDELRGELGDLLLQVVFHAQIATEESRFTVADVVQSVADKMVRRHPHVFGDASAESSTEVLRNWEALKAAEQAAKGQGEKPKSMLDSVSRGQPAILEGFQLQTKAGRVGFDWKEPGPALDKVEEETRELKSALALSADHAKLQDELGDLLFSCVNVARLLGIDPESALKAANRKFRRRFAHIEERLREKGTTPAESTLEEMDALWDEAKRA